MSLLWIQAAWHDANPDAEDWDEFGYGHETVPERGERYTRRVQDAHGVDRDTALHALRHVSRYLRGNAPQGSPVDYGFTTAPRYGRNATVPEEIFSNVWAKAPIHDVSLDGRIHASQPFVTHRNIAHNLFHPGKRPSQESDEDLGHPDAEPEAWSDEDAEDHDFDSYGPTDLPRMIRQTDGSHMVADGHHRVTADLLLGKAKTKARVIDIRDLGGRWIHSDGESS